jgi:hypothetical protein
MHVSNPYVQVHRRVRRNRGWRPTGLVTVGSAGLAVFLAGSQLLWFLPASGAMPSTAELAAGLTSVAVRIAVLVACAVLLHSYTDLVRGPDRAVLDVHPIRPAALVTAIAWRTARTRSYLVLVGAILLLPLALRGDVVAWLGGTALVCSAWLGALGVGFAVHLGGVWAASSPGMARLLDALRGDNPRMQAALIYAPGVGLLVVGVTLAIGSFGLEAALRGWAWGWTWLLLSPAVGLVAWTRVPRMAERHYVRASLILAEVDGEWASRETADEPSHVYLERLGTGRPDLLRALRQGWRRLRLFGTAAWVVGIIAALVVWTDPQLDRWMWVGGGSVLFIAAVGARLADGDPIWLNKALGVPTGRVAASRTTVAWLYAQGVVLPLAVPAVVQHGLAAGPALLGLELLALVGAVLSVAAGVLWRDRALWAYGPTGMVLWAVFVRISA